MNLQTCANDQDREKIVGMFSLLKFSSAIDDTIKTACFAFCQAVTEISDEPMKRRWRICAFRTRLSDSRRAAINANRRRAHRHSRSHELPIGQRQLRMCKNTKSTISNLFMFYVYK